MTSNTNTKNQQVAREGEPEVFSDADLAVLMARLKQDPAAYALVQKKGIEILRKLARETMEKLAAMEPPRKEIDASTDWRRFSGLAREREAAAKQRRELAQDLVIGTLVNLDNPDWNPMDPSTSKDSASSPLLALLNPHLTTPQKNGAR